jgi:hypothetical protein
MVWLLSEKGIAFSTLILVCSCYCKKYPRLGLYKEIYSLTVMEGGKSKIKVPASGEGLLAAW